MAVHQPDTWVVGVESDNEVSGTGQHGDVAAGCVDGLQRDGGVVGARGLGEDPEVVAVEVDGVGEADGVLDDEVHPDIGLVEVDDVLLGGEGVVASEDLFDG